MLKKGRRIDVTGVNGSLNIGALRAVLLLLLLPLMVTGCQNNTSPADPDRGRRMEAVATIFPVADMAGRLGGEKVIVTCLLPAGASPHTFEPTADQVKKTSRAGLLIHIGGGLDDWAMHAVAAASDGPIILDLIESALQQGWNPSHKPFAEMHTGELLNPHLWLDPLTARDYLAPAIAGAMIEADPQNEAFYRANLAAYKDELSALDGEIRASLAALPEKRFISIHDAWLYFAARYGLDQTAVISAFPGQEPSASWISELVDLSRRSGVRVLAAEPQLSAALAETISREIDGKVIWLDPLGGPGVFQRESYLDLMRYNTAVLKDAFSK